MATEAPDLKPSLRRRIPRQHRSKQKVERILAAAKSVLEQQGPQALHMSRVARDVGISIGTVYEYFPDKASIVAALIDQAASEEAGAVMARLGKGAGSIQDTFRAAIATVFDIYRRHHALVLALRALSAEAWDIGGRSTERFIQQMLEREFSVLLSKRPGVDPRMTAFVVFHAVESLVSRMLDHRDPSWSDDRCIDEITRLVLRYLGIPDALETQA